jgi:hypothetical protein
MALFFSRYRVPAAPRGQSLVVERAFLPLLLAIALFLPGIANAQQGRCFTDSSGRQVCCDANGNCR